MPKKNRKVRANSSRSRQTGTSTPVRDAGPIATVWERLQTVQDEFVTALKESGPLAAWAREVDRALAEPAFQRDPKFLERLLPLMDLFNRYFDAEVRGFESVPPTGPVLLVGNHSGGALTPDTTALIAAWYHERGIDSPLIGLAFDAMFGIPGISDLMRKIGEVPANPENAGRALDAGAAVLVYPGGDHEVYRPWTDRNRIDFGNRTGFVRLALKKQVPVIPVVGHGGHDSLVVLSRGEELARWLPYERLRLRIFPLLWKIPWGVVPAGLPGVPLPAKITVQICPPMDWSGYGPDDAGNPEVVQRCYDEITTAMQATLDRLARENPRPVLTRLLNLVGGDKT